jgi:hypothetical protein
LRLPREQASFEAREQRGRSRVYFEASGLSQRVLRKAAAKHTDGRDLRLARCGRIIGRIADRDRVGAFGLELLENDLEEAGAGLGSSTSSEEVAKSTRSVMAAMTPASTRSPPDW